MGCGRPQPMASNPPRRISLESREREVEGKETGKLPVLEETRRKLLGIVNGFTLKQVVPVIA